jgi:hypothetical protein
LIFEACLIFAPGHGLVVIIDISSILEPGHGHVLILRHVCVVATNETCSTVAEGHGLGPGHVLIFEACLIFAPGHGLVMIIDISSILEPGHGHVLIFEACLRCGN